MADETKAPQLKVVSDDAPAAPIAKPAAFDVDKFKSETPDTIADVETLLTALPHYPIPQAKDFVRLHSDEDNYWSKELCFVSVPIKGARKDSLHLIVEKLAMTYLPSARIQRFRLALGVKPDGSYFLCHVPTRNLDNSWNASNVQACEQAKWLWTQATSRREEGADSYDIKRARDVDAFAEPKWPTQSLNELIGATFANRIIETPDHPGLLRLIGAKQNVS